MNHKKSPELNTRDFFVNYNLIKAGSFMPLNQAHQVKY